MARMHKSRKGKSGSEKIHRPKAPEWVEITAEEVEKKIVELYKQGYEPSRIGMILRDQYGVPDVKQLTGKKLVQILREKVEIRYPEDLKALIKKALKLRTHLATHKKDLHNMRALQLVESKIWRLSSYYKEKGVLPKDWSYNPEKLRVEIY